MSYKQFFAAFNRSKKNGNPLTREEMVLEFTNGRTGSLKGLSAWELNELVRRMNMGVVREDTNHGGGKGDKLRKAIIAIFYQMNRKPADAIAWAEKQGVKGIKKGFNDYSNQELYILILVAEKMLADFQLAIRKRLKQDL